MTIMARSLGIPARVAVGYTNGTADTAHHDHVIRGTDAHSWTQVYFAGYGWINFEPSASFSTFSRPLPNQFPGIGSTGTSSSSTGANIPSSKRNFPHETDLGGNSSSSTATSSQAQAQLRQQVGFTFGGFVLLLLLAGLLFSIWWSRLFRRYGLASQLIGRLCVLASWAGIEQRPSQTPYEYLHGLTQATPDEAITLERLGDIYVRERWADPNGVDHPSRNGEMQELRTLWQRLQPRLFRYVVRHPYFLRQLPRHISTFLADRRKRRRAKRLADEL
jgi:hypothetical protein